MSNTDETSQHPNEQKNETADELRKKRRQKTGTADRDYLCNCGKSYLSYPALYTHIKNKHSGQSINGMVKKMKDNPLKQSGPTPSSQEPATANAATTPAGEADVAKPQQSSQNTVNEIIAFLKQISQELVEYSDLKDIVEMFGEDDEIIKAISQAKGQQDNPKVHPETGLITSVSIEQMFGKLIARIIGKIDKTILLEVVALLIAWRNGMNVDYAKFDPATGYAQYCREASPALLLESVNELVYSYTPAAVSLYARHQKKLLAIRRREYHVCKFAYLLSKWMYSERYTNLQIQFNVLE